MSQSKTCADITAHEQEMLVYLHKRFKDAFESKENTATLSDTSSNSFVFASAPGRVELAGNHVDYQGGRVISGAIRERIGGLARANNLACIRLTMEGFGSEEIDLADSQWSKPRADEQGTSRALVRGMVAQAAARGLRVSGFDAVICSHVPAGCGVSSSAAFEVMIGALLVGLFSEPATSGEVNSWSASDFCDGAAPVSLDPVAIALAGVAAENNYFGKPCGAQDQLASACGGVSLIDFREEAPQITPLPFNLVQTGYAAVLIDSRQNHSEHNDEFADLVNDMREAAHALGVSRLIEANAEALCALLPQFMAEHHELRFMRALHFYDEVARVDAQAAALESADFSGFLEGVRASGMSSAQFLQNVSPTKGNPHPVQAAMVVQSLCAHELGSQGAWRIHGGGFGGAILAFVPASESASFVECMNTLFQEEVARAVEIGGPGARAWRL